MRLKDCASATLIAATALVFVLGSAASTDAKMRTKMLRPPPPPPRPVFCPMIYMPVCAINKDGRRQTYANSCWAAYEGARVIYQGVCRTPRR